MQYSKFFDEIFSSQVVATETALAKYIPYLTAHKEGKILKFPKPEKLQLGFFDSIDKLPYQKEQENEKPGVAIIHIAGMLTKSGSWWDCGTDEMAETLFDFYKDSSVKAIVLDFDSAGGTTDSIIPMEYALSKRNKPVVSCVNPSCFSAANYIASLTDSIFAVHRMATVGSIGIMAVMMNDDKMLADMGIKRIEIYPPESEWKNKASREAKAGKPQLFIDEILSPWAIHFQDMMKAKRKKLDLQVEGILNGRTFYAYDAVKNGLIDGIKPMDEILQYALDYNTRKKFESL